MRLKIPHQTQLSSPAPARRHVSWLALCRWRLGFSLSLSPSSSLSHYTYVFMVSRMIYFCLFLLYSKLLQPKKKGSGEFIFFFLEQTEMQLHIGRSPMRAPQGRRCSFKTQWRVCGVQCVSRAVMPLRKHAFSWPRRPAGRCQNSMITIT